MPSAVRGISGDDDAAPAVFLAGRDILSSSPVCSVLFSLRGVDGYIVREPVECACVIFYSEIVLRVSRWSHDGGRHAGGV